MSRPRLRSLLLPLTPAFRLALAARELSIRLGLEQVLRLQWPAISVGSLSAGGAGKTPFTIALAKLLVDKGFCVDVLSRGYGRESRGPLFVHPEGAAEEYGDEPLVIARSTALPVYVAAERYHAGRLAENDASADPFERRRVHLLDDGFQHRQLARDVDIVVVNSADWHDHLLPAGNLREGRSALKRAEVIAVPAGEGELESELKAWGWRGETWRFSRMIEVPPISGPVAAFCGIARPEQFFAGLQASGAQIVVKKVFADHHRYSLSELEALVAGARDAGAVALVTTEKDLVRIGKLESERTKSLPFVAAKLRIEIENEPVVTEWLEGRLGSGPGRQIV